MRTETIRMIVNVVNTQPNLNVSLCTNDSSGSSGNSGSGTTDGYHESDSHNLCKLHPDCYSHKDNTDSFDLLMQAYQPYMTIVL
jgi:hypothetical protein